MCVDSVTCCDEGSEKRKDSKESELFYWRGNPNTVKFFSIPPMTVRRRCSEGTCQCRKPCDLLPFAPVLSQGMWMPSVSFCFLSFSCSFSFCLTDKPQKPCRTPDWMICAFSEVVVSTGLNGTDWREQSVCMLSVALRGLLPLPGSLPENKGLQREPGKTVNLNIPSKNFSNSINA